VTVFLLLLPVALSCLLLAAHVLRSGLILLAAGFALLPFLLQLRRPWVPRVMQLVLVVAAAEWTRTAVTLARGRIAAAEPWARMAVILGAVIVLALGSLLVFRHPEIRRRYEGS
jgi:hypothetical protein